MGEQEHRRLCYRHGSRCSGARGTYLGLLRGTPTSFFCRRSTRCKHFRRRGHVTKIQRRDLTARLSRAACLLVIHKEYPPADEKLIYTSMVRWRADVNTPISRFRMLVPVCVCSRRRWRISVHKQHAIIVIQHPDSYIIYHPEFLIPVAGELARVIARRKSDTLCSRCAGLNTALLRLTY